jgi:F-type H+-transporting ATPase subunit delta
MTKKSAATRYARALFDVAVKEKADLERIERDLAAFASLLSGHPPLEIVLLNPAVPAPRKRAAVVELTGRLATAPSLAKLLALLAERDRLVLVPDVLAAYRQRLLDHRNIVRAEVTTAVPLAPGRMQEIERGLARLTGRSVTLSTKVDPSILGGVIARVGSTVYDGSVTTRLEKLKQRLAEGA